MIRTARTSDLERLAPIVKAYMVDFYQVPDPGLAAVCDHVRMLLQHPDRGVQIVADEGDLQGFSTVYFTWSTLRLCPVAILNDLFVRPEARGRGLGEALFAYTRDWARDQGFQTLEWSTAPDNGTAQRLYQKMQGHVSPFTFYELKL